MIHVEVTLKLCCGAFLSPTATNQINYVIYLFMFSLKELQEAGLGPGGPFDPSKP